MFFIDVFPPLEYGLAEKESDFGERAPVAEWLGHVPWTNQARTRCRGCNNFATSVCVICKKSLCNSCYNKEENHVNHKVFLDVIVDGKEAGSKEKNEMF